MKKKLLFSAIVCIVVLIIACFVHQSAPRTISEAVDLTIGFKTATLCCFEDYEGIQQLTGTDLDTFVDWIGNISIFSPQESTPKRLGDYSLLFIYEDDPSKYIQIEVFDTYVYIIDTDENEYYYGVDVHIPVAFATVVEAKPPMATILTMRSHTKKRFFWPWSC